MGDLVLSCFHSENSFRTGSWDVNKMENEERGTGNGERGTGNKHGERENEKCEDKT